MCIFYILVYTFFLHHFRLLYHAAGLSSMMVLGGKIILCSAPSPFLVVMFINEMRIGKKTILHVIFMFTNEVSCPNFWYVNDYVSISKSYDYDSWLSDLWWALIPFQMYFHSIIDTATVTNVDYHQVPLIFTRKPLGWPELISSTTRVMLYLNK